MFKTLVWTVCAVGFGIFLASYEVGGRTPLVHAQQAWKSSGGPVQLDGLKGRLGDAVENARDKLAQESQPHEHHSAKDREALNKLIAGQASRK